MSFSVGGTYILTLKEDGISPRKQFEALFGKGHGGGFARGRPVSPIGNSSSTEKPGGLGSDSGTTVQGEARRVRSERIR